MAADLHPAVTVKLSASECAVAQMLASMRTLVSRAAGITNQKQGKQSQHKTEVEGMAAELAFAKHFNICPDLVIKPRAGGSDGILKGKTIDVKATDYPAARLMANLSKKKNPSDIFVLLIGKMPEYRIVGYAYAADLINDDNLAKLDNGNTVYALDQADLKQDWAVDFK
tara:strand:+ start:309 stop:815 length:507 start_codon:yes stop_codon:yes gene_type:complete